MTESTSQSLVSPPTPVAIGSAATDATDALAHLAKMSGTGSAFGANDYVAISPLAIISLLLGFASALSLVISLFLFIPVVSVILGLLAIRQIRNSGGTQSGFGFAIGGIALSLLVGGGVTTKQALASFRARENSKLCADVLSRFGDEIRAQHFDTIYSEMTTENFRDRIPLKQFRDTLDSVRINPYFGELKSVRWAGSVIDFEPLAGTDAKIAYVPLQLQFTNSPDAPRETAKLTDREGSWKIEGLPQLFPDKKPGVKGFPNQ